MHWLYSCITPLIRFCIIWHMYIHDACWNYYLLSTLAQHFYVFIYPGYLVNFPKVAWARLKKKPVIWFLSSYANKSMCYSIIEFIIEFLWLAYLSSLLIASIILYYSFIPQKNICNSFAIYINRDLSVILHTVLITLCMWWACF